MEFLTTQLSTKLNYNTINILYKLFGFPFWNNKRKTKIEA